ncbi:MAG: hypothetical protein B7O98_06825 [Zestosphaera tikiterensis]|uniref:Uncharacterized protein n=1 Tax=Zestosphaera tikiterensis TaxID=1973259 RepID=A0A2R7Y485_9CREN|nr:MAG: hypothetical protein B7O98_06825 [Zestosphaera tikiterensis]
MAVLGSKLGKGVALALLALLLASITPTTSLTALAQQQTTTSTRPSTPANTSVPVRRGPEHAVQVLIDRTELLIARIKDFTKKYNITLPENLSTLLSTAEELVNEAKNLLPTDVKTALNKTLEAMHAVTPIYVYVIQNLPPQVKDEFAVRKTEAQFEVRQRTLEGLNKTVAWLEERGVEIPDWVKANLSRGFELIQEGKTAVAEGNLTRAKELMKEIDEIIKDVNKALCLNLRLKWRKAVASEKALKSLIGNTQALVALVNKSAEMLADGNVEQAKVTLKIALRNADNILNLINLVGVLPLGEDNYSKVIELCNDIASKLKEAIESALGIIDKEDQGTALSILSSALDSVEPEVNKLKTLCRWAWRELEEVRIGIVKVRDMIKNVHMPKLIRVVVIPKIVGLGSTMQIKASYTYVKNLYERGVISCGTYKSLLTSLSNFIKQLIEGLQQTTGHGPGSKIDLLKQELQKLLDEINNELSQLKC